MPRSDLLLVAITFLLVVLNPCVYPIAQGIPSGDSGEFVALTLSGGRNLDGIAHPPGYPVEIILRSLYVRVVTEMLFFLEEIPLRLRLQIVHSFSLLCAALSAACLCAALLQFFANTSSSSSCCNGSACLEHSKPIYVLRICVCVVFPLLTVFNGPALRYATETEVFALNQLLVSAGIWIAVRMRRSDTSINDNNNSANTFLAGAVFGIAMCHQHAILFVAAPIALLELIRLVFHHCIARLSRLAFIFFSGFLTAAFLFLAFIVYVHITHFVNPANEVSVASPPSYSWLTEHGSRELAAAFQQGDWEAFARNGFLVLKSIMTRTYYSDGNNGSASLGMFSPASVGDFGAKHQREVQMRMFLWRLFAHLSWLHSSVPSLVYAHVLASLVLIVVCGRRVLVPSLVSVFDLALSFLTSVIGFAAFSSADLSSSSSSSSSAYVMHHVHERFWLQSLLPLAAVAGILTFDALSHLVLLFQSKMKSSFRRSIVLVLVGLAVLALVLYEPLIVFLPQHREMRTTNEQSGLEFALGMYSVAENEAHQPTVLVTTGDVTFAPMLAVYTAAMTRGSRENREQETTSATRRNNLLFWIDTSLASNSWFRERFILKQAPGASAETRRKLRHALNAATQVPSSSSSSASFDFSVFVQQSPFSVVYALSSYDVLASRRDLVQQHGFSFSARGPLYRISRRQRSSSAEAADSEEQKREHLCGEFSLSSSSSLSSSGNERKAKPLPSLAQAIQHFETQFSVMQGDAFVSQRGLHNTSSSSLAFPSASDSPHACLRATHRVLAAKKKHRASAMTEVAWDQDIATLCALGQHATFVRLAAEVQSMCLSTGAGQQQQQQQQQGEEKIEDEAAEKVRLIFSALSSIYTRMLNYSSPNELARVARKGAGRFDPFASLSAMWALSRGDAAEVSGSFRKQFIDVTAKLAVANPKSFLAAQKLMQLVGKRSP